MTTTPTDHRTTHRHHAPAHSEHGQRREATKDRTSRVHDGAARRRAAARRESAARVGRLAGEQLAVAGGQLGAGVGNLVFALIAARLLAPDDFAELAAFLALYLLIHVPAGSLSAGSALAPELAARARRRAFAAGSVAGGALVLLALPLGALLDVSPLLLVAAGAAAPTAGLLALDRGRLYGLGRRRRVVASLLAEPAVRLTLGVALAAAAGPVGGAVAVVVAGWAALAVAYVPPRATARRQTVKLGTRRQTVRPGGAVAAFLLLAVVQNQDVVLANALLDGGEAGRFAVISTLGGAAAFATTTVPLMLLGRADDTPRRDAFHAAVAVAGALGLGAVAFVALSPQGIVGLVFGARYVSAGAVVVPYVFAMALLGVARVLVAHACAQRDERRTIALLVPVAILHAALLVALGDDAAGIALATLIATMVLTAGAAALAYGPTIRSLRPTIRAPWPTTRAPWPASLPPALSPHRVRAAAAALVRRRDVAVVAALALGGLALRLLATRGIWLDEATSIHQARMPLGQMLEILRSTDVHPPLHHIVLWCTVRILGTGELAVRIPSLLASTALIPLLYVVGRDLYDRRAGYAAAALGAVAPFAVWYAQEARMYALFMVFALLAVWFQVRILRDGARPRDWVGYVLAAAALVYTQYFGLFFVAVQQAVFAVAVARGTFPRKPALAWTAVLVLLIAPLIPFALDQFAANESAGRGFQQPSQAGGSVEPGAAPGAYAALTNAAWAVLGYHSDTTMTAIAALWPLGLLLALALLGRGRSWPTLLVAGCAVLPAIGLFLLGQLKPFVFEVRYFIGMVPLALLLIARGLTTWARRPAVVGLVCAAAVAVLGVGLADQQLNGSNPRVYDFKQAVHSIEDRARPGDVIVYSPRYVDTVVSYYEEEGLRIQPLEDGLPRPRRGQRVFLLASFLDKPQYREATEDAVRTLSRRHELVRRDAVPQIRTWEFRR